LRRRRTTLRHVLRALRADSPARRPDVLVVIARSRKRIDGLRLGRYAPAGVRVIELVGRRVQDLHDELSRYDGSGMVVVDARPSFGWGQLRAFRRYFLHLNEGDVWVALRSPRVPEGKQERLVKLAGRLLSAARPGRLPRRWREYGSSTSQVRITSRLVVLEKDRAHLLKVRDERATDLLNAREPVLQVAEITSRPGGALSPAGTMTDYEGAPQPPFPRELVYPDVRLRRYEGRVSLPAVSLAVHGRSVLPDSFRWHRSAHPVNKGLRDVDEWFARPRPKPPGEPLEGSYYFFCYNHPGHFGHLMTEAFSKLWGWDAAKAADPGLKLLCREHPYRPGSAARRLERVLLPAYGIDMDDVVWTTGPVTVEHLVGATPLWHNAPPYYVHPAFGDDWRRLREGLPEAAVPPTPKIFVTRRPERNRCCRNGSDVEALFAEQGFAIVRPETMPIPEQAALFARARVIAGFGGSGMFNLGYAEALETLIVLNQSAYWGRSEHLFAALLGVDSHFFWSDPDPGHAEGSYEEHQSAWEFDFARNSAPLERLLRGV
jgi:capsular polysaccharide biosynthesis protein